MHRQKIKKTVGSVLQH